MLRNVDKCFHNSYFYILYACMLLLICDLSTRKPIQTYGDLSVKAVSLSLFLSHLRLSVILAARYV